MIFANRVAHERPLEMAAAALVLAWAHGDTSASMMASSVWARYQTG
jgi:hypothetical protein